MVGSKDLETEPSSELTTNFSQTARALLPAGNVEALQRAVDLAVATIDGCDFAGIFLLQGETVTTPADCSSQRARRRV